MGTSGQKRWTRDETLAVLSLYVQIPFGKMHANNPDIVTLAEQIGRTPSSVALKLVNFASLDPAHQKRGIRGMSNTSALDREVWQAFYGNWQALAEYDALPISDEVAPVDEEPIPPRETETVSTMKTRRGQQFFRRAVLAAYGNRCCLTGIAAPQLLRASHIVPWSANEAIRLSPDNGLALNTLHDAAFDRGLLTFDEDARLILAKQPIDHMPRDEYDRFFRNYDGKPMQTPERFTPQPEHLDYHRKHIFLN